MSQQIRTRWHNAIEAFKRGEAYFTAPFDGIASPLTDILPDEEITNIASVVLDFDKLPRFVIAPELHSFVKDESCHQSFMDMKKADCLRLPYPAMMIELPHGPGNTGPGKITTFVILRDLAYPEVMGWERGMIEDGSFPNVRKAAPFYAWCMNLQKDETGEYLVIGPVAQLLDIDEIGGEVKCRGFDHVVSITAIDKHPNFKKLAQQTFSRNLASAYYGLFASLLIMTSSGVEKEVIECARLNRKRKESGKERIAPHSYIYLSKVYKSAEGDQTENYDHRSSPRPHWRRAHARRVAYGKGRSERRWIMIEGRFVAAPKDAVVPLIIEPRTYVVKP